MNKLAIIQIITAFLAGGAAATALSFASERVSSRHAGIILSFPSTSVIAYFFLGWSLTPERVPAVVPSAVAAIGLAVVFAVVYSATASRIAKNISSKLGQIVLSASAGFGVWGVYALLLKHARLTNISAGIIVCLILCGVCHIITTRQPKAKPVALVYTPAQKILRMLYIGGVIGFAVLISKIAWPFWGGVFTMFPAAYSSTLMILHWYYGPAILFPTIRKTPLGAISPLVYSLVVALTFPMFGFVWGSAVALCVSVGVAVGLANIS